MRWHTTSLLVCALAIATQLGCNLVVGDYEPDLDASADTDTDSDSDSDSDTDTDTDTDTDSDTDTGSSTEPQPQLSVQQDTTAITEGYSFHFGEIAMDGLGGDTSDTYVFSIFNNGDVTLTIDGVALGGTSPNNWQMDDGELTNDLEPDSSTSFSLTYDPIEFYGVSATLTISSNDPVHPDFEFTLTGTGLDVVPPVPGGDGAIQFPGMDLAPASLTVTWAAATDNLDTPPNLEYQVVRSEAPSIDNVADAVANGTVAADWTAGVTNAGITGLTPGTMYYFNVLVRDMAENTSAYEMDVTATPDVVYVFPTETHPGNWTGGSRSTGDSNCEARRADAYPDLPDTNVLIFLSYGSGDAIAEMPTNYDVPADRMFVGPDHLPIASNWSDMFTFDLINTLADVGACMGTNWWAGSGTDGAGIASNCTGWTSDLSSNYGYRGSCLYTDDNWISNAELACNYPQPYLCLAWD
jgi:hypothetical protein